MPGQPKPAFYVVVALVVLGLVAFAIFRSDLVAPKGKDAAGPQGGQPIDPAQLGQNAESESGAPIATTVKEYAFRPAERLPEIKGTAAYSPMENNTVQFALNVWAGWAPIFLANEGMEPKKVWKTPDGQEFRVQLVLADDPVDMITAYSAGKVHIGWGTLDMVPLFVDGLVDSQGQPKDSRVMPRIFQQIDWSNGGDGIVVRKDVGNVGLLRGRKVVFAQNSPSQYFALNMLVAGGVQPSEVNMIYTKDAFQAAAAFNADKTIAGCVSWAPDIYNLAKVSNNRMLVTTQTANKLIADVWYARADFAKDHPGIIEGLVRGIFDAMEELKKPDRKDHAAKLMASGYNIPPLDAVGMLGDAHNTNWAENYQFFVNENNPTNFERVWTRAYYLYRQIGTIRNKPVRFDQVMDFSIIQKLGQEEKYKSQKDEYAVQFAPRTVGELRAESSEVLTNTVVIHFAPNDWNLNRKKKSPEGTETDELYDPTVPSVLEGVAGLVGTFGAGRVIIEGHTDSSMRGQVDEAVVRQLSMNRANAVKEALVEKHKLNPDQFLVDGMGWSRPADAREPYNHAKNRRVEIKVYPAERE